MPRYDDCFSCAFHETETVICEDCDEADQWEPAEPTDLLKTDTKTVKFYNRHERQWKRAA